MEMDQDYRSDSGEASFLRRWLFRALIASILLHLALVGVFRATKLTRFTTYTERLVPRAFTVKRVDIDPKLLEDDTAQKPEPKPSKKTEEVPDIMIPSEQVKFEDLMQEIRATPTVEEAVKPLLADKPNPETAELKETSAAKVSTSKEMQESLAALSENLLKDVPSDVNEPLLKATDLPPTTAPAAIKAAGAGYSDLDDLLARSGELKAGTAPILMPTDLLFDYDSASLRIEAVSSLQKLSKLIKRNPNAKFTVEGHTDSTGGPAYNMELSRRRAESVKDWMVQNTGVDPRQVATKGYGSTRLIAPPSGSIEEEQINRRVEIVIQAPK